MDLATTFFTVDFVSVTCTLHVKFKVHRFIQVSSIESLRILLQEDELKQFKSSLGQPGDCGTRSADESL